MPDRFTAFTSMDSIWIKRMLRMRSSANSLQQQDMSRSPSASRAPRIFPVRRRRISLQVRSCFLRRCSRCHSTTIYGGGRMSKEPTGAIRQVQTAISAVKTTSLLSRSLMKMRRRTQNGQANDCRRKLSGSLPRAGAYLENHLYGETNFGRKENGWPIPTRDTSPTRTQEKMDSPVFHQSHPTLPTHTASTIWREMYGSGHPTGIVPTIINNLLRLALYEIREGLPLHLIRQSRISQRKFSVADRICAQTSIVSGTSSEHGAKAKSVREQIISD